MSLQADAGDGVLRSPEGKSLSVFEPRGSCVREHACEVAERCAVLEASHSLMSLD